MKNHFLFSLCKLNYTKLFVVLICFTGNAVIAQNVKKQHKNRNQVLVPNATNTVASDVDQVLEFVISDFAAQFSSSNKPSTVIILDSYTQLVNKRYSINGVDFIAGGKPEILVNNGISIAIWRLDITENSAHVVFYYTDSKNQTFFHEYKLIKENAIWRK